MEFFNTFPFTKLQGKNRGLDWVMQKMGIFQAEIDKIPDYVEKAVENVDISGNVAIDETLTKRGFAADAEKVGERFSVCDSHFSNTANPHAVTADQINAAPAGFGLGERAFNAPGNDANQITKCGFFRAYVNTPTGDWWTIQQEDLYGDGTYMIQKASCFAYAFVLHAERMVVDGKFYEWEWANPPMLVGVEYRTTERHNGKVVYSKLFSCGTLAAGGTNVTDTTSSGVREIIRYNGMVGPTALPFMEYECYLRVGNINGQLTAVINAGSLGTLAETVYAQAWYTKEG